jgi:hypothetical protein
MYQRQISEEMNVCMQETGGIEHLPLPDLMEALGSEWMAA